MIGPDGIPFFEKKNELPSSCFMSAESVWWCIEHIQDVETEAKAIVLMQIMCDFDLIRHISNTGVSPDEASSWSYLKQQKVFVHGFYLYYIVTDQNRTHHRYTKDYCEVSASRVIVYRY